MSANECRFCMMWEHYTQNCYSHKERKDSRGWCPEFTECDYDDDDRYVTEINNDEEDY